MNDAIKQMLKKYKCHSENDYVNALKEIFQEIALLALWRAKFYEYAAFYGGSALRILYGLDRFSEDLDFTLLRADKTFSLASYNQAIADELHGFGFNVEVVTKNKQIVSNIESAFIKAEQQLIVIETPSDIVSTIHKMKVLKIKMEVDVNPPGKFTTEVKNLLQPIPFAVKTLIPSDLFAGKIHALLCPPWQVRIKGRDWYDFVWYIGRNTPVNLIHLCERLVQSKVWNKEKKFTLETLKKLLKDKIIQVDFSNAKKDVEPFLNDPQSIALWSNQFFLELVERVVAF